MSQMEGEEILHPAHRLRVRGVVESTSKNHRCPADGRGVPPLCPRLAALLPPEAGADWTLLAALRVGASTRVLKRGRFRLLYLAWAMGMSLAAIGDLTEVESDEAVRKRLARASDAVEDRLAADVAAILVGPARTAGGVSCVRGDVLRALEIIALG